MAISNQFGDKNKYDGGKIRPSLVPVQAIRDIAEVREYGYGKYGDSESWLKVDPRRYVDALYRHLLAVVEDPYSVDEESGLEHYKHLATNAAFLCELFARERRKEKDNATYNRHSASSRTLESQGSTDAYDADASDEVSRVSRILQKGKGLSDTR